MRVVISRSGRGELPLSSGNYRAFIYSQKGDQEIGTSFTQSELIDEIARLTALGESTAYYARALQCLQFLNGPTKHLPDLDARSVPRSDRAMQAPSR
jgi:hypothetical protein